MKLLKHQINPAQELADFFLNDNARGMLLMGQTGCGKTFILAEALRICQIVNKKFILDLDDFDNFCPVPVLMLVPKNSIIQTKRVLYSFGLRDIDVQSSSCLSSSYSDTFVDWIQTGEYDNDGEPITKPVWKTSVKPQLIIADEVQKYKNSSSTRTMVLQSYINSGGKLFSMSATPFSRASEAKIIVTSAKIVSDDKYNQWATSLSYKAPTEYCAAAVGRIKEKLENTNAFIEIKGVRYPFKPIIRNYLLKLEGEKRRIYDQAFADYLEEIKKLNKDEPKFQMKLWVSMLKFRQRAEELKAEDMANRAYQLKIEDNASVIVVSNFVEPLALIWEHLIKKGVLENEISFLVGGMSDNKRQEALDNFQNGKTRFFLTTMKSGGESLNLQHEKVSSFPRRVILPPTWSVFEMTQVLGRAQRINSLSQTIQEILWFADTIEEKVASKVAKKYNSMRELSKSNESFIQDIFGETCDNEIIQRITSELEKEETKIKEDEESEPLETALFEEED